MAAAIAQRLRQSAALLRPFGELNNGLRSQSILDCRTPKGASKIAKRTGPATLELNARELS
jgi:hypothetical protein